MNDPSASQITRAAWLYYVNGYTQAEVAKRMNVSRAKAHRLIDQAHRNGYVKVFIESRSVDCVALEDQICRRFGLRYCSVVPSLHGFEAGVSDSLTALGVGGARFLYQFLEQSGPTVVGFGQGRTLAATVDRLPAIQHPYTQFVALLGGLTRKLAASPFDATYRLAERTGGEGYFLPTPLIADSIEDCQVMLAQRSVQQVLAMARQCELYIVSIGDVGRRAFFREIGMITAAEYRELTVRGAVGEMLAQFFDSEGRLVDCDINRRAISLRLHELEGRDVVAVAGGISKTMAITAALRSGLLTGLVTDETAARQVLANAAARERAAVTDPAA